MNCLNCDDDYCGQADRRVPSRNIRAHDRCGQVCCRIARYEQISVSCDAESQPDNRASAKLLQVSWRRHRIAACRGATPNSTIRIRCWMLQSSRRLQQPKRNSAISALAWLGTDDRRAANRLPISSSLLTIRPATLATVATSSAASTGLAT